MALLSEYPTWRSPHNVYINSGSLGPLCHSLLQHKTETRVKAALKMKREERVKTFDNFKNEGILNQTLQESGKKHPNFVKICKLHRRWAHHVQYMQEVHK